MWCVPVSGSSSISTFPPIFFFLLNYLGLGFFFFFTHIDHKESVKEENSVTCSISWILVGFAVFFWVGGGRVLHIISLKNLLPSYCPEVSPSPETSVSSVSLGQPWVSLSSTHSTKIFLLLSFFKKCWLFPVFFKKPKPSQCVSIAKRLIRTF